MLLKEKKKKTLSTDNAFSGIQYFNIIYKFDESNFIN